MVGRFVAIPAAIVVLGLVAVAMFSANEVSEQSNQAEPIQPGEPSPHEERGLCASCHLIGGPGAAELAAAMNKAGPAVGAQKAAPPITADQIRPHAERGSCINCHTVIAPNQASVAGPQPGQLGAVSVAGAMAMPMAAAPMQTALLGQQGGSWGGMPAAGYPQFGQLVTAPSAMAAPPTTTFGPTPSVAGPQWLAGTMGGAIGIGRAPTGAAPPIVEGVTAPHDWRGQCGACHPIVRAQAGAMWQPSPSLAPAMAIPLPASAPRPGPGEAEALGMSVRPTAGDVRGMLVVEVEGMARRAGLELGDIIRAVDGQLTASVESFLKAMKAADPTRGVVLDTVRDGRAQVLILR